MNLWHRHRLMEDEVVIDDELDLFVDPIMQRPMHISLWIGAMHFREVMEGHQECCRRKFCMDSYVF